MLKGDMESTQFSLETLTQGTQPSCCMEAHATWWADLLAEEPMASTKWPARE